MRQNWHICEFRVLLTVRKNNYVAPNWIRRASQKINSINDTYLETRIVPCVQKKKKNLQ